MSNEIYYRSSIGCKNCRGSGCIECQKCLFRLLGTPYTYRQIKNMDIPELEKLKSQAVKGLENDEFNAMIIYTFISGKISEYKNLN